MMSKSITITPEQWAQGWYADKTEYLLPERLPKYGSVSCVFVMERSIDYYSRKRCIVLLPSVLCKINSKNSIKTIEVYPLTWYRANNLQTALVAVKIGLLLQDSARRVFRGDTHYNSWLRSCEVIKEEVEETLGDRK